MTPSRLRAFRLTILLGLLGASGAVAGPGTVPTGFQDQLVVGGLRRPVGMTSLADGRLLVVEQATARIRLIVNGALAASDPVCTVAEVRTSGSEQGLLGIAVDPGWPARPYVYVHYDHSLTANIHVARFTAAGDLNFSGNGSLTIDPATRHLILTDIPDNASNHNGGTLRFGPDGMLYVSLGEDAVPCASQDTVSLRGVILRLDVSGLPAGPGGPPAKSAITPATNPLAGHSSPNARLVWTLGLRNPFRFSIDFNGEIFVGDVGQNAFEEISRAATGGINLGWPLFEAFDPFSSCAGVSSAGMTAPIYAYPHGQSSQAVVGGPVYRYPACSTPFDAFPPEYFGDYFFSEYYTGFLRRLKGSGGSWTLAPAVTGQPNPTDWGTGFGQVADWAVGCDGALWYCRQSVNFQDNTGEIRRIAFGESTGVPPGSPRVEFRPPWPSPAADAVHLEFNLSAMARVELRLFDQGGRLVRRILPPELLNAGRQMRTWDGRDEKGNVTPAGIYFARLEVDGRPFVRRFPKL